jgi:pimeloyl-ACP methyl ester carboxylesterase
MPMHIFVFDYRGYGKSSGVPSERGTARDVAAAWEVVHERLGRPEDPPVLLYGRSLGGAVALQLGSDHPVRGVVLESTFTSVMELAQRFYPWLYPRISCRHPYRSDLRLAAMSKPVLIAHSRDDEVVPFDMGEALFRKAPHPWKFCELQGGHEQAGWQTSSDYAIALRAFAREVGVIS